MSTRELDRDPVAQLDVRAQVRDLPIDPQPPGPSVDAAHVLARRWKRERQLEFKPDAVRSLVGDDPGQRQRPGGSAVAPGRLPAAISERMSQLRTARPSSANGGTTTTSNLDCSPSAASASGVP